MFGLLLALSVMASDPTAFDSASNEGISLVREVDLTSGDSPLFVAIAKDGINLASYERERLFKTAPLLRLNEQNKVLLLMPRRAPLTVGHLSNDGHVMLCHGWMGEIVCEATMKVDELNNTAILELIIPRRDGTLMATFREGK